MPSRSTTLQGNRTGNGSSRLSDGPCCAVGYVQVVLHPPTSGHWRVMVLETAAAACACRCLPRPPSWPASTWHTAGRHRPQASTRVSFPSSADKGQSSSLLPCRHRPWWKSNRAPGTRHSGAAAVAASLAESRTAVVVVAPPHRAPRQRPQARQALLDQLAFPGGLTDGAALLAILRACLSLAAQL